jgi:hypothetical protein
MALVRDFENGDLNVSRLNYAIITLIPKEPDAREMRKFRPISLGNCSLKIISKAITNRISPIGDRIIASNQTAFIKGRFILESVVAAQELIHAAHVSGVGALVLKLDYEKAYDRVSWSFLEEMLASRGFGPRIRRWIQSFLVGGSSCVRINDTNGPYFKASRGLKQGDPCSPILFNLVADVFTKMLSKAAFAGLIRGLLPQVVPGGVISLQYADDTILFLENDERMARNLKWFLSYFEQMSGMKINFHKSDLMTINIGHEEANAFAQIFCCKIGAFPFKYLGVPLHFSKLRKKDLQPVVDKTLKRFSGWRGKLLNLQSRLILLKACIASIPMYLLAVIKFPKWALKIINSQMAHFLWSDEDGNKKYHLANWDLVSMKQEFGGLGI